MVNFFKGLKNRLILFLSLILFISLIPYFIFYFINQNTKTYTIDFKIESIVEVNNLINYESLNNVKEYYIEERENEINSNGSSKKVDYSTLDINKLLENIKIEENSYYYTLSIKQNLFTSKTACKKYFTKLFETTSIDYINESIITVNEINLLNIFSISLLTTFIVITILFIIIYFIKPSFYNLDIEYDNINLYRTIFHRSYWSNQLKIFKSVKGLTSISILFSLMLLMKLLPIPSGFSTLGLSFTYLIFSVITLIYGPTMGLIIGFLSDIFGYFISPSVYGFYLPYTINSMLAGFTYGICFYKTNVSYSKCLMSRVIVNLFINVLLGSIWWSLLNEFNFEQFRVYLLVTSLPKNLFYLLPQSILQFVFLKTLSNPLKELNYISIKQKETFRIF